MAHTLPSEAHLAPSPTCFQKSCKTEVFERAFKTPSATEVWCSVPGFESVGYYNLKYIFASLQK